MIYPWPLMLLTRCSTTLLGYYLETTRQAYPYSEIQKRAAETILGAWRAGERHPIKLANFAIKRVEQDRARY